MWWDADAIQATVSRQFVCAQLLPHETERLDRPLGFGDGLTDGTYWEWIDQKAKRLFLILVDIGVPDQIFGIIDDSWDDEDLPIAFDQIERLALTPVKDDKLERMFYYRQFHYLLRPLQQGVHETYLNEEVVPIEVVDRKQGQSQWADKVVLPRNPGVALCRRRIPLEAGPGTMGYEDFQYEVNGIRNVQHEHMVSYWGSYTHQGYGYVLFTPASDFSLKAFLLNTPASVKNMDKHERRRLVMNWIHCLVDALCYLHTRGLSHGNIRPSTILFTSTNSVCFADFTCFNSETADKTSFDKESYDHAAPEQWFRPTPSASSSRKHALSISTSPDSHNFSISRGPSDHTSASNSTSASQSKPTPYLNPQAADIFSLGCVILELLSFQLKKHGRPFATHRAAKHKSPGRGGAVPDSSFHKNLGQVESWMAQLAREADKKGRERDADPVFRGITPMLRIVEKMLALQPGERPSAHDVQTGMYKVLTEACGISEPHCVHQYGGWDFGMGRLKISAAATSPGGASPVTPSGPGMAGGRQDYYNGREVGSGYFETASIGSRRTGSSGRSLDHRRTNSSASSTKADSIPRSPNLEVIEGTSPPSSTVTAGNGLGSGFQAIQNIRIKDRPRAWQASPVYSGDYVLH